MRYPRASNRPAILAVLLAVALLGCGGDGGSGSTADEPTINAFSSSATTITSGSRDDANFQGEIELAWNTEGAAVVTVLANGEPIGLEGCEPLDEADIACTSGRIALEPEEDTVYTLLAAAEGVTCADASSAGCASEELAVATLAPAQLTLGGDEPVLVEPGADATIPYSVESAESWQIGILAEDGNLMPCVREDAAAPDSPCLISAQDGEKADSGDITLAGIEAGVTLAATAENGAEDGLGDIELGDVTLPVNVVGDPAIVEFNVDDDTITAGRQLAFDWTALSALQVELSASPAESVQADLSACSELDAEGLGSCMVDVADDANGDIVFILVALGADGTRSAPASVRVQVGEPPTIDSFSVTPGVLPEGGGTATASWQTSSATDVSLAVGENADDVRLDTAADLNADQCASGDCSAGMDSFDVANITVNTSLHFRATNEFGSTRRQLDVVVAGGPQLTAVGVAGEDALAADGPIVVESAGPELTWTSQNANSTTLERAPMSAEGCGDPMTQWQAVSEFQAGASGTFDLQSIDGTHCFRLTALGDADQQHAVTLTVVRRAAIASFSAADDTVVAGRDLQLDFETVASSSVVLTASPAGVVSQADLDACSAADMGSCTLSIQPGAPQGTATFTLVAMGDAETQSDPAEVDVTIGIPTQVTDFSASPDMLSSAGMSTLSWTTSSASELEIIDGAGNMVHSTTNIADVTSGSTTVMVSATTTFTLVAANDFSDDQSQVTVFLGPSVSAFDIGMDDALDGSANVVSGDIDVSWTTANADSSLLHTAPVPMSDSCADVMAGSWMMEHSASSGDSSTTLQGIERDRCMRLTVSNAGGASSELLARLRDQPLSTGLATTPNSLTVRNGGTVEVTADVIGASTLTLLAQFQDGNGNVIEDEVVCEHSSLSSGMVADSAAANSIMCEHERAPEVCIPPVPCQPSSNSIPRGTESIHYVLTITDVEGDQHVLEDASQDVAVSPN